MRIDLDGCRPRPLAAYLKALAVLRLASAPEGDPEARGGWQDDRFALDSRLDRNELVGLLARAYRPTPILAPWNGGSGFYPKDRREAIERLRHSAAGRFAPYRRALAAADAALATLGADERPTDAAKERLVRRLRATLPDDAVAWLDSVLLLGTDRLDFPPLLGSGGNDGRLEFTNNFMQRLVELIDPESGEPRPGSERALRAALFDEPVPALGGTPIGQFHPAAAGGANAGTGFTGSEPTNPWDYVLMLEGALLFSASATRRGEVEGSGLSYPFTVRALSAGGSGGLSGADAKTARGEMWLPLWSRPASRGEVERLLGEGRLTVGRRIARDGLDAARAIAALGVDRGFRSFERVAFGQRNGLAYLATSQGRFVVPSSPHEDLAADLDRDDWRFRLGRAAAGADATGSLAAGARRLEDALFDLTRRPGAAREVLVELGRLHHAIGSSKGLRERLAPVRLLRSGWAEAADDGTPEMEAALALASLGRGSTPLRWNLYPLVRRRGERLAWDPESTEVVAASDLDGFLLGVAGRRAVWLREGEALSCLDARATVRPATLAAALAGSLDRGRVRALVDGLALVGHRTAAGRGVGAVEPTPVPAAFALVKLFLTRLGEVERAAVPEDVEVDAPRAGGSQTVAGEIGAGAASAIDARFPFDLEPSRRAPWILARLAAAPRRDTWEEVIERCRVWWGRATGERFGVDLAAPSEAAARRWAASLLLPLSRGHLLDLAEPFLPLEHRLRRRASATPSEPQGAIA